MTRISNAWVPDVYNLAWIGVQIEDEGDGTFTWAYIFGDDDDEVDPLEDSGNEASLGDCYESIARSLCEVGFDTSTDLVEGAFGNASSFTMRYPWEDDVVEEDDGFDFC